MKSTKLWLILLLLAVGNTFLFAQSQPNLSNGMPPQGSYDGSSIDTVNLVNGNLTLHIPLPFDYPQRGKLGIKYYLVVNAKTWQAQGDPNTMTGQWWPTSACGTGSSGPCGQGSLFVSTASFGMTRIWQKVWPDGQFPSYSATDPDTLVTWDGSSHELAGFTTDTSGYRVAMSGDDGNGVPNIATIMDRNGTQYVGYFSGGNCTVDPGNGLPGATQTTTCIQRFGLDHVIDANGNVLSTPVTIPGLDGSGGPVVSAHLAVGSESVGCLTSFGTPWVYFFNYPAPNGQSNQIKLCFSPYPQLATSFSQPGVHQFQDVYSGHPFPGTWRPPVYLTNVIFSDNTQWSINYDSYGEITSVGTPTGATIQYGWGEGSFPRCNVAGNDITKVSRAVLSRTVTDVNGHNFVWNYQWTPQAGDGTLTHTIIDPNGNDSAHVFVDLTAAWNTPACNFRETRTTTYDGSGGTRTPLQQIDTTWALNGGLGVPTDVKTTLLPSQKVSLAHTDYDPTSPTLGLATSKKIYDWGQGAPGVLLREDDTVYQWQKDSRYLTANMLDLPASLAVISPAAASNTKSSCPVDAIGTLKSCMEEIDFTYDESSYLSNYENTVGALPSGSHLAAPNPVRGNPTTVSTWLSTGSVIGHMNWYDTGMLYVATDPGGHSTTHSYDLAYKGILPTKTCNAKNQCVSATYDINTGLLTSFTDANGSYSSSGATQGDPAHTSTYSYDVMARTTAAISPADPQGLYPQVTVSYPNASTTQKIQTITASLNASSTVHGDGLGHISGTENVTPGGTVFTDTTYDGIGHVKSMTNPYYAVSDPTYGVIQTEYDGLGRPRRITEQDGSIKTLDYTAGNCTLSSDEAAKPRRTCSDVMGRLVEVDEPNPGSQATSAQGTLTINGTLQSQSGVGAVNAVSGSGSLTIMGSERSVSSGGGTYCAMWNNDGDCVDWEMDPVITTYDTGTVTIIVNGHSDSTSYDSASNPTNIATGLASAINGDANAFINASASNGVLSLSARQTGAGTNYSWSLSSVSGDVPDFGAAGSFSSSPTSGTLSGGANGSGGTTVYDAGTVTVTIGTFVASASYGQGGNSTAALVAGALAGSGPAGLNRAGSPVSALASGANITLTYNTAGTAGNGITVASSSQSTQTQWTFSPPSFTSAGTSLANGMAAGDLNNSPFITQYQYDALGNLLRVDQKGSAPGDSTQWRTRLFTYDPLSRVLTATNPESGTISYSYDADGNVLHKTSPAPNQIGSATQTISYCYDELHRVTGKAYSAQTCQGTQLPQGTAVASYVYDSGTNAKGHLTSLTDQAGTATYGYDILGRLATETRPIAGVSKNINYSYNLDGSLKTLTYPSGRVITYAPDSAGRLISAVDGNGTNYVTSASYNPDGSLKGFLNGSTPALNNNFQYTPRLQLCRITTLTSGTLPTSCTDSQHIGDIMDRGYDFHAGNGTAGSGTDNGNVFGITNYRDANRSQAFTYDALNRLTSGWSTANTGAYSWGENYSIDAWGNLQISPMGNKAHGGTFQLSGNVQNRPTGLSYDSAGNLMSYLSATYTYDAENRLSSTAGMSYTYDGNGKRILKSQTSGGAAVKRYWFMGGNTLAEADGSGNLTAEYVYLGKRRVARIDLPANSIHYYLSDHLASTTIIASATGAIEEESDYSSFGIEFPITSGPNPYKFSSKERDIESGLDNLEARYYSAMLGRFMRPDPLGGHQRDPQTLDQYSYVRNNPANLTDPTGLDFGLQCEGESTTCHDGQAGKTVSQGGGQWEFVRTVVGNDSNGNLVDLTTGGGKYSGTVDSQGVHLTGNNSTHLGVWIDKTPDVKFTQTSGALAGFSFTFSQPQGIQTLRGWGSFTGSETQAEQALKKAGFEESGSDNAGNIVHCYPGTCDHFRTSGDPGTGKNSAHFILQTWEPADPSLWAESFPLQPIDPTAVVPRDTEFHWGETNPHGHFLEHICKDLLHICN